MSRSTRIARTIALAAVLPVLVMFLLSLAVRPTQAAVGDLTFTIEAPGVQTSQVQCTSGLTTENFDASPLGFRPFLTSPIGTYTKTNEEFRIVAADQFGGAGGSGRYIATDIVNEYFLGLDQPAGYFGFWWSGGDGNNRVEVFMEDGTTQTFSTQSILDSGVLQGTSGTGTTNGHYGNPNGAFINQATDDLFAYVNIYATNPAAKISGLRFVEVAGSSGAFESDNHTVCADILTPDSGTDIPQTGSITIVKEANPESEQEFPFLTNIGGANSQFVLKDNGTDPNSITFSDLDPDEYDVFEQAVAGWQLVDVACSGGSDIDAFGSDIKITLHGGEDVTCTYTNEEALGTIIIEKQTVPGGLFDFDFTDNIEAPNNFTLDDGQSKTFVDVVPGTYTVTEADPGPSTVLSGLTCDDTHSATPSTEDVATRTATINLDPNETVTCTFTNSQKDLIIVQKVTHPGGGTNYDFTADWGNFSLDDGDLEVQVLTAGDYTITEDDPGPQDALTSLECAILGPGEDDFTVVNGNLEDRSVDLSLIEGQIVFCVFENTAYAEVTINKDADPDDDTEFDFELSGDASDSFTLTHDTSNTLSLLPGEYKIQEIIPDGWRVENIVCSNGDDTHLNLGISNGEIFIEQLAPGDEVECTYNNVARASITIEKEANPDDDTEFPFVFLPEGFPFLDLFILQDPSNTTQSYDDLPAGSYFVGEAQPPNWHLTNLECDSDLGTTVFSPADSGVDIDLAPGDTVFCTFTNVKGDSITIVKNAAPADGTDFDFEITGPITESFTLDDAVPDDNDTFTHTEIFGDLQPGDYRITETVPTDWNLQFIECEHGDLTTINIDYNNDRVNVDLHAGDDVVCTFHNVHEEVAEDYIIIEKVTNPPDGVDFNFEFSENSGTAIPFTLDDGEIELIQVNPNSSYTVSESDPGSDVAVSIECFGGGNPQILNSGNAVEFTFGPAGNEVAWCTFTNTHIEPQNGFCPVDDPRVGQLQTDFIGRGMGSPTKAAKRVKLVVPDANNLTALYGQLAAVDVGVMKWVRFAQTGEPTIQINPPTSPAYRQWAVDWWGTELAPKSPVRADFFVGPKAARAPRGLVLWPTYRTAEEFANVFTTFDDSLTNHVYFNWIPTQTHVVDIPDTQNAGANILVKVALIDNQADARPVVLTVTPLPGGTPFELVLFGPNVPGKPKGWQNTLNLEEILLNGVPAGTTSIEIELFSPGPFDLTYGTGPNGGDSVAMIGAAISYACDAAVAPRR